MILIKLVLAAITCIGSLNCMNDTPLIKAVKADDLNEVKVLLEAMADIEQCDDQGLRPLYWATLYNHKDIIDELIGAKANFYSAMQPALLNGNLELLKKLVKLGADCNKLELSAAINICASNGYSTVLDYLFNIGLKINHNTNDQHPIITATISGPGYPEIIKTLLINKVDVNFKSQEGHTALHYAAKTAHHEVMKVLLENKADVDDISNGRITPMNLLLDEIKLKTTSKYNDDINQELAKLTKDPFILKKMMLSRNVIFGNAKKSLKLLLEYGAKKKLTLEHIKTIFDTLGVTDQRAQDLLLASFNDIKTKFIIPNFFKSGKVNTALMYCCARNNIDMASCLLKQGSNVIDLSLTNDENETALTLARKHNRTEVIKLLVESFAPTKEKILAVFEQLGLPKLTAIIFMGYLFDTDWV